MLNAMKSQLNMSATGISYLDSGNGTEVFVFLHGISSGALSWVKQFRTIGEPYRLIAWNAPGYGESRLLAQRQPLAVDYAVALKEFLDSLQVRTPITLVGHSLGALQAAAFAKRYGDSLKRLVLVNPAQGYGEHSAEKRQSVYEMRPQLLERLGNDGMARERGPNLLAQKTLFNLEVVTEVTQGITLDGLKGSSYLLANDTIGRYLSALSVPVSLLYGEQDTITPPAGMFSLHQEFPFLELHAIADAGHLAYLDQPEAFNHILLNLQDS